jgi:hypothetical protein
MCVPSKSHYFMKIGRERQQMKVYFENVLNSLQLA